MPKLMIMIRNNVLSTERTFEVEQIQFHLFNLFSE